MKKIILSLVLISSGIFAQDEGSKRAGGKVVSVPLSALIGKGANGNVKVQFFAQCNTGTPLNISYPALKIVGSFDNPNYQPTKNVGGLGKTCTLYAKVFPTRAHKLLSDDDKDEVVKNHRSIANLRGSNSIKDQNTIKTLQGELKALEDNYKNLVLIVN